MFKPKDSLDRLFEIGIVLKGLNGLADPRAAETSTPQAVER
jgi:hypothetical protein